MEGLVFWLLVGVSQLVGVGPDDPFVKGFKTQADCQEFVKESPTPPDGLFDCVEVKLQPVKKSSSI